jgi:hypothetical protein
MYVYRLQIKKMGNKKKKKIFLNHPHISVCLASCWAGLDEVYSYLVFKSLSVIARCPENINILLQKHGPFSSASKTNITIKKEVLTILIKFR